VAPIGRSGLRAAPPPTLDEVLTDAIRYWERRRIAYNAALAVIVVGWVAATWPHFRGFVTPQSLLLLFILAVLANLAFCAAYVADVPMQYSAYRDTWRRWRWLVFAVGTLFACALAYYWIADEVYPFS
jgi:hypothetical protein